jgi:uncharacterized iron-regulated membrane protein
VKTDPSKLIGLIGGVLGLYVTVAGLVSDAKVLPGLYWIGAAILLMFACALVGMLIYGAYGWIKEEVLDQPLSDQDEQLYLWGLGAAAVLGLILTLTGLSDPASKDEARAFGFLHLVGLLGLVGGALLLFVLYNERSQQERPPA